MKLFMTSSPLGAYRSAEAPTFKGLNPANGMVDELKAYWKEGTRCLLISAFPEEYGINDRMREDFEAIFKETCLSVACMDLCDRRWGSMTGARLSEYDMVILGGGHVPTQKAFFDEIGLRDAFASYDGIVMGISAGSMNCADVVYAQPEMPGEAVDPAYQKFIRGLGLTDVNILPHYQAVKDDYVDGLRLMEEITYPDSACRTFYAIVDGSFVLQTEDRKEIRGEAYRIADGLIRKICAEGEVLRLAQGYYGIRDVRKIEAVGLDIYGADVDAIMREAEAAL